MPKPKLKVKTENRSNTLSSLCSREYTTSSEPSIKWNFGPTAGVESEVTTVRVNTSSGRSKIIEADARGGAISDAANRARMKVNNLYRSGPRP